MSTKILTRNFFARDTQQVARELLGKILIRRWDNKNMSGRITEVESYVGEDDLACHAARGRTPRTEVLYGPPGYTYVYLIYGVYHCLNFVTEQTGFPAAVLIRSLEPLEGVTAMQTARHTDKLRQLTTGPGKLTQALHITRDLNHHDATKRSDLYVVDDGFTIRPTMIAQSPRVGVDYAEACALYPWRYYLKDSEFISKK